MLSPAVLVPVARGRELAAAIPGSRLVELPDTGHVLATDSEEMVGSSEVQELVATLEQQYDALQADRPERVPSAEEIAAEFERFLAEREKND